MYGEESKSEQEASRERQFMEIESPLLSANISIDEVYQIVKD